MSDADNITVTIAAICERTSRSEDGIATLERVVDTFSARLAPDDPARGIRVRGIFVVEVKTVNYSGLLGVRVDHVPPTGARMPIGGGGGPVGGTLDGVHIEFHLWLDLSEDGIHWFEVFVNDVLRTRSPLLVRIDRVSADPPEPSGTATQASRSLNLSSRIVEGEGDL